MIYQKNKLKKQIISGLLSAMLVARMSHEEPVLPLPQEERNLPISVVFSQELEELRESDPVEDLTVEKKQQKTTSNMLSLREYFLALLFLIQVWLWPKLSARIKDKISSSLSKHRYSLLATGLTVLLFLLVYFLIPAERRRWIFYLLILWSVVMLVLAIWSLLKKDPSSDEILQVSDSK